MAENPTNVVEFPHVSYANPYFTRAYGVMWAIDDMTAQQALTLRNTVGDFSIASEEFFDENEVITISTFGREPYKQERPKAIYKIPEHSKGTSYLLEKNKPKSMLLQPVWVESFSDVPEELSALLKAAEKILGFGGGELIDIQSGEAPTNRKQLVAPHISQTVRKMIGLARQ